MRFVSVQHGFYLTMLLMVTLAFFGLIRDLLMPIFWAIVLAILFQGTYQRSKRLARGRSALAAVLTIVFILVIVVFPLLLMGAAVTREAVVLFERVSSGKIDFLSDLIQFAEKNIPMFERYLHEFVADPEKIQEHVSNAAVAVGSFLASRAVGIGQDAIRIGLYLALMIYVLFFFLRDGDEMIRAFMYILPLGDVRERELMAQFAGVSRATIKGVLVVGVVQGALGGLFFFFLGIGAPAFWGMIMAVFSFLPAIGPAVVWLPAAIILMIAGDVGKGIVLLLGGILIISLIDNILRPILVGRDTRMPDFLVLLSTIGGLAVFGISGVVIGPIIAALFLTFWRIFGEVYVGEDQPESKIQAISE
jgi:predicted PurR-regulated permease PerM